MAGYPGDKEPKYPNIMDTVQCVESSDSAALAGYVPAPPVLWISTVHRMPKGEEVVLIHVRLLGEYGVTSAWWCSDDECWVALDDEVQYEFDKVSYWASLPELPGT